MPINIQAPDGSIAQFPDGMSDDAITAVMRQHFPPSGTPPISDATEKQLRRDMPLTATDLLTYSNRFHADRSMMMQPSLEDQLRASAPGEAGYGFIHTTSGIAQGLKHLFGSPEEIRAFDEGMAQSSRRQKLARILTGNEFAIEHPLIPGTGNLGETAGQALALGPIADAIGPALGAAGKVSPYLAGGIGGATFGELAPVDTGPEGYKRQKLAQILGGTATGVALPAIANAMSASPKPQAPPLMTTDQLEAAGSAEFDKFKAVPVQVTPDFADAISGRYGKQAINAALDGAEARRDYPLADELKALLDDDPTKLPPQVSAGAADKISRAFREIGTKAMKSDEGTVGSGLFGRRNDIEAELDNVPGVTDARRLWRQYEKSQIIDNAIQTAKDLARTPAGTGSIDQSLRVQFGKIITDRDLFGTFTPEEQHAITQVRNGTLGANVLQRIGKTLSPYGNALAGMTELGLAGFGGHLPAAGMAATGIGAQLGANALTSRNAALASELIRRGGPAIANASAAAPAMLNPPRNINPMAIALARALAAQGAQ